MEVEPGRERSSAIQFDLDQLAPAHARVLLELVQAGQEGVIRLVDLAPHAADRLAARHIRDFIHLKGVALYGPARADQEPAAHDDVVP